MNPFEKLSISTAAMPELTLDQAYALALQHHQAGRLAEAEDLYRQILAVAPQHADSLHNLGVLVHQAGKTGAAFALVDQALALRPAWPEALNNRGEMLRAAGQLPAAIASYRQALSLRGDYLKARHNLASCLQTVGQLEEAGTVLEEGLALQPADSMLQRNLGHLRHAQGRANEALAAYERALKLAPAQGVVWLAVGNLYSDGGHFDQAIAAYRQAIAHQPDLVAAHCDLGNALISQGRTAEALAAYEQALRLNPDQPVVLTNLGIALRDAGRHEEALAALRRAVQFEPHSLHTQISLGNVLHALACYDEALAAYRRAVELEPTNAEAQSNLANLLTDLGQIEAALPIYKQALALQQGNAKIHTSWLLGQHYSAAHDPVGCAAEHRRWAAAHAVTLPRLPLEHVDRTPERRLRIGYVSPDFREHAVARLLWPLWEAHDHGQFELFAYAQVSTPDKFTERFRACADHWRNSVGLSDQQLAEQIRADRIDILVDLAGHTSKNRLLVFARKPAPLQVSFLGYPNTTGLATIDSRLTDAYADPPGATEAWHTEELWRLAPSAWCIELPEEPAPAPRRDGPLTFGCFNNLAKITEPILKRWCEILRRVPDSRLLLKYASLSSPSNRERIGKIFQAEKIEPERIELQAYAPSYAEHLALYQRLDVALDPYPYHGTVSTCEALWMGVPVVTLAGPSHVSRVGVSLLSNVGLPELIARTPEEYCELAVALANDPGRLQELRTTLRARMQASPLRDAAGYARQVENAYRQMWRRWCAEEQP